MRLLHYVLFGIIFLWLLVFESWLSPFFVFIFKSFFLITYLSFESYHQRRKEPERWMLNPAILASVFTFILSFGITNLLFLIPDSYFSISLYNKMGEHPFELLSKAMTSIILGSIAMWFGYKSKAGTRFYNFITKKMINLSRYVKSEFKLNYFFIFTFIIVSILARLHSISLGIYGYAQSPEELEEATGIAQTLYYLGLLGTFSFVLISLSYFSNKSSFKLKILFITMLSIELFFGIISGMKSAAVMPVFIPFVCYLIINNKINKSLMIATLVMLFIAYAIIEPFRILRNIDRGFKSDPVYIIETMFEAYEINKQIKLSNQSDDNPFIYSVLGRTSYIMDAAKAIEHKDERGLTNMDPDFKFRLYTFPLQAFVPRAIWQNKPKEDIGLWFTQEVWGYSYYSSTAMSPIGFLYFAGGNFFIVVVFFIIGILQRTLVNFLKLGAGGAIIFLGLLGSVVLIDSTVNTIFVNWIRNLPILIFLQYIFLKR